MINNGILFRKLVTTDLDRLLHYLYHLSNETKSRFGPHPFDKDAVTSFYNADDVYGYIAEDSANSHVIAYSIIKKGVLPHDSNRLLNYNYPDITNQCCTYAPSVADDWQGKGIGQSMLSYIIDDCKRNGITKIILWGGVQCTNERAVHFYKKAGFKALGIFEYNGFNQDMLLEIL